MRRCSLLMALRSSSQSLDQLALTLEEEEEEEEEEKLFRVYKKTGQARDEGVSIKRSSTSKEFKRRSSIGS